MAENPENYMYHRGLQSCILKNGDFIDGDGTDLPVLHVTLTDDQVSNVDLHPFVSSRRSDTAIVTTNSILNGRLLLFLRCTTF